MSDLPTKVRQISIIIVKRLTKKICYHNFFLFPSVSASTITMTQSPSGPLPENTDVIFTCVTDEAEPTADVVWSVDGNTRTSATDFTEEGMYNTQKKRSVLAINVVRTLNNKKVECNVSGKLAVRDTITLDVTCECFCLSV